MRKFLACIISFYVFIVVVLAIFIFLPSSLKKSLENYYVVYSYNYFGTAEIRQLAEEAGMNLNLKATLYKSKPTLVDYKALTKNCPVYEEEIIELGCYKPDQKKIYLLYIAEPRLKTGEAVTAAHEALHRAYYELDSQTKSEINQKLESYYQTRADEKLIKRITSREKSAPDQKNSELHSILGTEMADLPADLEQYYDQNYFESRQKVLQAQEKYQQVFDEIEGEIKNLQWQLTSEKNQIEGLRAEIFQLKTQMENDLALGNIDQYNANVPIFNSKVSKYNTLVENYNKKVSELNQTIKKYEGLIKDLKAGIPAEKM